MNTRYTKQHYEDVAGLLNKQPVASVGSLYQAVKRMGDGFADLFAADNPACCIQCGDDAGSTAVCISVGGRSYDEHNFEGGFNRARFLAACGLEKQERTVSKQILEHYGLESEGMTQ
jgi:hypothetical protein